MADKNIFLSLQNNIVAYQPKVCFMPLKLMKYLNLNVGSIVIIKAAIDVEILCEIIPVFSSYYRFGYQVLVSCDILLNNAESTILRSEPERKINCKDIVPVSLYEIKQVDIILVLSTVEAVLSAKKRLKPLEINVKNLLSMYIMQKNCTILCSQNNFAKKLCISRMIIKDLKFFDEKCNTSQSVGMLKKDTQVNLVRLDNEESILYQIHQPVMLGGLNNILEYLKSFVNQHEASTFGSPGVLLIGPPGCGKTSIVRQLCTETQACLIATSGAELQSPYEGETQFNLSKIARRACMLSEEGPCIFFIDEIDSICSPRNSKSSLYELRLTSQVLLTFDECNKFPNLLLIAATNRPYALDLAARRSGRLETEILLNIPNEEERQSILEIHSSGFLSLSQSSVATIAKATPGFVGADLKELCAKTLEKVHRTDFSDPNVDSLETCMLRIAETITPSIHKSLDFITSKPKVSSIGGMVDIKQKLQIIFNQHCLNKELRRKFKLKQSKGVLLYGPRGCGKTRLISSLASQKGFTFISANASHLLSPYVGDSEKRIAALFHSARLAQPSILFIDEIDGIFGTRENGAKGVHLNLLTELLQEMDGSYVGALSLQGSTKIGNQIKEIKDDVLVCAATNNPQNLDSALLRPGRFDHLIYIPPPDKEARAEILKIKTSKLLIEGDILTLDQVAENTNGWTGAELETLISRVAMMAVLRNSDSRNYKNNIFISKSLILDEVRIFSPSLTEKDLKKFREFQIRIKNK